MEAEKASESKSLSWVVCVFWLASKQVGSESVDVERGNNPHHVPMVSAVEDWGWVPFPLQNKCSPHSVIVLVPSSSQNLQSHILCSSLGPDEESGSVLFLLSTLQWQGSEALVFLSRS